MVYLVTMLEGLMSFISPCFLPMLPLYFGYLGGVKKRRLLTNVFAFMLGFTLVFIILGAFSGIFGKFLVTYKVLIRWLSSCLIIIFGLSYLGLFELPMFTRHGFSLKGNQFSFLESFLFGIVMVINWTPCVGNFLASALMLAANQSSMAKGMVLLLFYALGLSIPLFLSALLFNELQTTFSWIKEHFGLIQKVCGIILIITGLLLGFGLLDEVVLLL